MSLEQQINDAISKGLTGLTLWRVGVSTMQWQASSQWRGREGFNVRIEPDPLAAVTAALQAGEALSAAAAPAVPAAAPTPAEEPASSVFD